jgi:hypothetical protein
MTRRSHNLHFREMARIEKREAKAEKRAQRKAAKRAVAHFQPPPSADGADALLRASTGHKCHSSGRRRWSDDRRVAS